MDVMFLGGADRANVLGRSPDILARLTGLHVRARAGGAPQVNVLFLDQYNALGGAQQCLLDLLPAVEERGWSARVAIPDGGPLADRIRARGIRADAIQSGPYRSTRKSAADVLRFAADMPAQIATIR